MQNLVTHLIAQPHAGTHGPLFVGLVQALEELASAAVHCHLMLPALLLLLPLLHGTLSRYLLVTLKVKSFGFKQRWTGHALPILCTSQQHSIHIYHHLAATSNDRNLWSEFTYLGHLCHTKGGRYLIPHNKAQPFTDVLNVSVGSSVERCALQAAACFLSAHGPAGPRPRRCPPRNSGHSYIHGYARNIYDEAEYFSADKNFSGHALVQ